MKTKKDSTAIGRTTAVTKSVTLFVTKKYKKTQKIVTKGITEDKNTIKKNRKIEKNVFFLLKFSIHSEKTTLWQKGAG